MEEWGGSVRSKCKHGLYTMLSAGVTSSHCVVQYWFDSGGEHKVLIPLMGIQRKKAIILSHTFKYN